MFTTSSGRNLNRKNSWKDSHKVGQKSPVDRKGPLTPLIGVTSPWLPIKSRPFIGAPSIDLHLFHDLWILVRNLQDPQFAHLFGSVPLSFLTHIQLVLVEGWPAIGGPMLGDSRFWATYLVIFILLSLSGLTGVILEWIFWRKRRWAPFSVNKNILHDIFCFHLRV